jgi:LPXTG-motif cell wall-anchored protein
MNIGLSPWAFAIIGLIFFLSGIGIVKRKKDTDEV